MSHFIIHYLKSLSNFRGQNMKRFTLLTSWSWLTFWLQSIARQSWTDACIDSPICSTVSSSVAELVKTSLPKQKLPLYLSIVFTLLTPHCFTKTQYQCVKPSHILWTMNCVCVCVCVGGGMQRSAVGENALSLVSAKWPPFLNHYNLKKKIFLIKSRKWT